MENLLQEILDKNLRFTLAFGIGLHHAGLHEKDQKTVEELFVNQKIQVNLKSIIQESYWYAVSPSLKKSDRKGFGKSLNISTSKKSIHYNDYIKIY